MPTPPPSIPTVRYEPLEHASTDVLIGVLDLVFEWALNDTEEVVEPRRPEGADAAIDSYPTVRYEGVQ